MKVNFNISTEANTVKCKHHLLPGNVVTEISSDAYHYNGTHSMNYIDVKACNSEACFVRDITYSAPLSQMVALIDISEQCNQEIMVNTAY